MIHQVLGNIVRKYYTKEKYVDAGNTWILTLSEIAFATFSVDHRLKSKFPGKLSLIHEIIFTINHIAYWKSICLHNKAQTDDDRKQKTETKFY